MVDYSKIADDTIEPGKPGTQILFQLLRDNPLAVGGKNFLVYTSSGTLTVTDQMADAGLLVFCLGGGGKGGDGENPSLGGGGGGGGGLAIKRVLPGEIKKDDVITVTVGGAQQASIFGTFCTGGAGSNGPNAGGGGGSGGGGIGSNDGGAGAALTVNGEPGNGGGTDQGGEGGDAAIFGAGGRQVTGGSGRGGRAYGGGGSGGVGAGNQGANGAAGVIFILY